LLPLAGHEGILALKMGTLGRMALFMSGAQIGSDEATVTTGKGAVIDLLGCICANVSASVRGIDR
jgi:hypothetical protein